MKKAKILAVVLSGLVLCCAAVPRKADYREKTEMFLAGLLKGEIEESYDRLLSGTLLETKTQEIKLVKAQTHTALNMYGKLLAYEFIRQKDYGDSVVRLVYVLKTEQLPLAWEFYFYKADSEWELVNFNFNDQFDLLAEK